MGQGTFALREDSEGVFSNVAYGQIHLVTLRIPVVESLHHTNFVLCKCFLMKYPILSQCGCHIHMMFRKENGKKSDSRFSLLKRTSGLLGHSSDYFGCN